ncbi:hypothetical protein TNCV_4173481 [Trichonephila clavipes]|nr:hypothetical protein TNCV_4173481 [Trichonephila clavipes]
MRHVHCDSALVPAGTFAGFNSRQSPKSCEHDNISKLSYSVNFISVNFDICQCYRASWVAWLERVCRWPSAPMVAGSTPGCVSPVVKVSDHNRHVMSSSTTKDPPYRAAMHAKSVES